MNTRLICVTLFLFSNILLVTVVLLACAIGFDYPDAFPWKPSSHSLALVHFSCVCVCISEQSVNHIRVSYKGGGGALESPPPPSHNFSLPPRNLEIEYGFYISYLHVTEHKYVSSKCLQILSQIVSEAIREDVNSKIFLWGRGGGGCPQIPIVGTNALLWSCHYPVSPPSQNLV